MEKEDIKIRKSEMMFWRKANSIGKSREQRYKFIKDINAELMMEKVEGRSRQRECENILII